VTQQRPRAPSGAPGLFSVWGEGGLGSSPGTGSNIRDRGIEHWADPRGQNRGELNTHDGGRGVYFQDPSGHYMEAITVPYGGW